MLARLLPLDHEGRQDRTGCCRAPNAAGRKCIQREGVPDARLIVAQLTFVMKRGNSKLRSTRTSPDWLAAAIWPRQAASAMARASTAAALIMRASQ